jgi:hypothetical protein
MEPIGVHQLNPRRLEATPKHHRRSERAAALRPALRHGRVVKLHSGFSQGNPTRIFRDLRLARPCTSAK